jgi:AcrR family transcriptional regulator
MWSEGAPKKSAQMLNAAKRLFARSGYAAVSMDDIAKMAGVSKTTLYAYFDSKENLFAEILENESAGVEESIPIPEAFEGDAEGVLRRFAYGFARFFVDGRGLEMYRLFVTDLHRFPDLVRRFHAAGPMAMRARLARLLAQMAEAGALSLDDPELAADNLASLVQGRLPFDRAIGLPPPARAEIERHVDSALRLFLRGYAPVSRRAPQ